jgi:hypothetical protein
VDELVIRIGFPMGWFTTAGNNNARAVAAKTPWGFHGRGQVHQSGHWTQHPLGMVHQPYYLP